MQFTSLREVYDMLKNLKDPKDRMDLLLKAIWQHELVVVLVSCILITTALPKLKDITFEKVRGWLREVGLGTVDLEEGKTNESMPIGKLHPLSGENLAPGEGEIRYDLLYRLKLQPLRLRTGLLKSGYLCWLKKCFPFRYSEGRVLRTSKQRESFRNMTDRNFYIYKWKEFAIKTHENNELYIFSHKNR